MGPAQCLEWNRCLYAGEVHHQGDDEPGGDNARTDFDNMREKDGNDDRSAQGWTDQRRDFCWFKSEEPNQTDHFKIYTKPKNHDPTQC
jgi:hypothetical protein